MQVEAIIVLGHKVDPSGSLLENGQKRAAKAAELWHHYRVPLIFCGKWSYKAEHVPPITEAAALAKEANRLGVPQDQILLEEESMHTWTNAFFTRKNIVEARGWRNLGIITSDYHLERALIIFDFIYGDGYTFTGFPVSSSLSDERRAALEAREKFSLEYGKECIAARHIPRGDLEFIERDIYKNLPGYAEGVEAPQELR